MLINKNTRLVGCKVILVPYRKEHVPKYHKWMQSEELQQLTASEPLSLEEEYKMQESWCVDENKLTFIILDKNKYNETQDEVQSMVGDTNLFFLNNEDFEPTSLVAEIEIMIAEKTDRGNGFGKESLLMMMSYSLKKIKVKHFVAKISIDNNPSVNLFASLGFAKTSTNIVFKEITMERIVDELFIKFLTNSISFHQVDEYLLN